MYSISQLLFQLKQTIVAKNEMKTTTATTSFFCGIAEGQPALELPR
jgi:hypothetical protein